MKCWIFVSWILSMAVLTFGLTVSAEAMVEVRYEWPSVNGLKINNACATRETFRSLKPVMKCVERGTVSRQACAKVNDSVVCRFMIEGEVPREGEVVQEDVRCLQRESQNIEVSNVVEEFKCAEFSYVANPGTHECLRRERRRYTAGRVYDVSKYEVRSTGDVYLGEERFVIPVCQPRGRF